jgi:N-acetyl-gamma-glutamyl-phosphate reductase
MKYRVFVDGQEGTTGLRIHEYLAHRSDVELLRIDAERRRDVAVRAELLNAADVAFLCLPDDAARAAAALVRNPKTCLIDASTAHRTAPGWTFGLPELTSAQREQIRASKRIANPGCHATGFILLMRPLIDAGLVDPRLLTTATSITGYSGGGRKMIEQYQVGGNALLAAPRPYGLKLAHKHLPEMMAHTGLRSAPIFMPIVANFYKGLAVSVPLHLDELSAGATAQRLQEVFELRYGAERFIHVHPMQDESALDGGFFDVQGNNDTNRVDIFVFGSSTQTILISRLDNLGKGASGAAVQAMNVHLGLDEALGL